MSGAPVVAGFLPTTNGLHFSNSFPSGPTVELGPGDPRWIGIGDASAGLCGGMSWYTREQFDAKKPIPADTAAPEGTARPCSRRSSDGRCFRSLDWLRVPLRFYALSAVGQLEGGQPGSRSRLAEDHRLPRRRPDAHPRPDPPVVMEPVRPVAEPPGARVWLLGTTGSTRRLRIYDPNHPDIDKVVLEITDTGLKQSTGETLLDLFDSGLKVDRESLQVRTSLNTIACQGRPSRLAGT